MLFLLFACQDDPTDENTPEPLDLPADPAETGVPVGVRTETWEGLTLEVWYPAAESAAGEDTEQFDVTTFVPQSFVDHVGEVTLPPLETGAVRAAPLRLTGEGRFPVVVFSHGFGGMRVQSVDITTHLASRGYVVVAADHPGRMLGDVLPCAFSPPDEGCDMSGFLGEDVAVEHVSTVADWVEANADDWSMDADNIALAGHSAGAGTTATAGDADARFRALLPMAAPAAAERDVPQLVLGGTCDSFALDADMLELDAPLVRIAGAGHLAFTDLCELDLTTFGETLLGGREDVSSTMYGLFMRLAGDGCAGITPPDPVECDGYLDLATSDRIVRHYSTVFLDAELRGTGAGPEADVFAEATLTAP